MFLFAHALVVSAADRVGAASTTAPIAEAVTRAAKDVEPPTTLWSLSQTPKRPALLPILYGTYAGLQVMDVVSTRKALAAGAHEANPVMSSKNMGGTIAIKTLSGALTYYAVEKTWKKHRAGAIVLMAVMNGTSAAIVARNNRNARK
jgi:hypothetical protein